METPNISKEFWATISFEEFRKIMERRGRLNAEQCRRLWSMEKWPGKPPESLELLVKRAN
jgi:hypothetical protein